MKWRTYETEVPWSIGSIATVRSIRTLPFSTAKKQKEKISQKISEEKEAKEATIINRRRMNVSSNVTTSASSIDAIGSSWRSKHSSKQRGTGSRRALRRNARRRGRLSKPTILILIYTWTDRLYARSIRQRSTNRGNSNAAHDAESDSWVTPTSLATINDVLIATNDVAIAIAYKLNSLKESDARKVNEINS